MWGEVLLFTQLHSIFWYDFPRFFIHIWDLDLAISNSVHFHSELIELWNKVEDFSRDFRGISFLVKVFSNFSHYFKHWFVGNLIHMFLPHRSSKCCCKRTLKTAVSSPSNAANIWISHFLHYVFCQTPSAWAGESVHQVGCSPTLYFS